MTVRAFVTDADVYPARHLVTPAVNDTADDPRFDFRVVCMSTHTVAHDGVSEVDSLPDGMCGNCHGSVHAAYLRGKNAI